MPEHNESDFAEVIFDRLIIESFPVESSAYHKDENDKKRDEHFGRLRNRVMWHINHTLKGRQKEVIKLILTGKKQAEIGAILGVKQQVVNIYKQRAIKKLRSALNR
jgi:DNA-directed RNA polymerase specialized sigma subunit